MRTRQKYTFYACDRDNAITNETRSHFHACDKDNTIGITCASDKDSMSSTITASATRTAR